MLTGKLIEDHNNLHTQNVQNVEQFVEFIYKSNFHFTSRQMLLLWKQCLGRYFCKK